jgi:MFS family permease
MPSVVDDALSPSSKRGVVHRYYLYVATVAAPGFLSPVWVVLLESRGLAFAEIAVLDAVLMATILAAELPTGYVGDRIGRRNALVLSSAGLAVVAAGFAVARTLPHFFVVYLLWGVAQTFQSGNDSAWLYDALDRYDAADEFARVSGRAGAVMFGVGAVASLAGGVLAGVDLRYPFFVAGAGTALGVLVLAAMPDVRASDADGANADDGADGGGRPTDDSLSPRAALAALGRLARPPLRGFVALVALLLAVSAGVDLYVQPVTTRAGLPLAGLGMFYAIMSGASALASNYAGAIRERVGAERALAVTALAVGVCCVALLGAPLLALPVFLANKAAPALAYPLAGQRVNDAAPSMGRATVMSGVSMAVSLATAPLKLGSGPLADATRPLVAVAALGTVLLVGTLLVGVATPALSATPGPEAGGGSDCPE